MDPELKSKWISALRSGEYKQGKEYLRDGDTWCCLGVLAKVQGFDVPNRTEEVRSYRWKETLGWYVHVLAGMNDGRLREIQGLLRVTEAFQNISMKYPEDLDKQYTFPEIADYIERTL